MKIAYTSDIHIGNSKENSMIPDQIYNTLKNNIPDVFILAGDISRSSKHLEKTLAVLKTLSCIKLFVPGNHDIWIDEGCLNSYTKYVKLLPDIAQKNGFIPVWIEPLVYKGYGFCGSMGWYDYSFKDKHLDVSDEKYADKIYNGYTWMDKVYARFIRDGRYLTDKEITHLLFSDFTKQYEKVSKESEKVIALFHHIPFREFLVYRKESRWNFFNAYMGSSCFGDFLQKKQKIRLVICGHSHNKLDIKIPRQAGKNPINAVLSPFGYFRVDGVWPISRWYSERLSFFEV